MKEYIPRYVDRQLEETLEYIGATLIVGPKWCGKTTTAKQFANSEIQLQNPQKTESYLKLADTDPLILLEGENPRLIDEWQMAPKLWDAVRYSVDERNEYGLYILTGSTMVDNSKIMHSGAGRITRLLMRPMSLYESGDSTGEISIRDLFDRKDIEINGITSKLSLKDIIFLACRGGWPEILNIKNKSYQLKIAQSYIQSIYESDTSIIDGVKRNPKIFEAILKSYSRNVSTLVANTKIIEDIKENYREISKQTFYSYVNVLKKLYVIENINAWSPNLKSKQKIRKSEKKGFIDPSLAVASLGLTPEQLLQDFKTFGFIFESLCIRDLHVYSSTAGGKILYYNDGSFEVDCILQLNDGRYALIEFKLGDTDIEKGAENLLKLKKLINNQRDKGKIHIPEPTFLAVVTGDDIALKRDDGVYVLPIGVLK